MRSWSVPAIVSGIGYARRGLMKIASTTQHREALEHSGELLSSQRRASDHDRIATLPWLCCIWQHFYSHDQASSKILLVNKECLVLLRVIIEQCQF